MRERGPYQYESPDLPDSSETRGGKHAEIMATLERGIEGILDSDGFAAYLRAQAKFHAYSFNNTLLITAQKPEATRVAGFWRWKELGRSVRKGEKGLWILVPYKQRIKTEEDEEEPIIQVTRFGLATVFDISQTEGRPLPEPPAVQLLRSVSDAGAAISRRLTAVLTQQGVAVRRGDTGTALGSYHPGRQEIVLSDQLAGDQATKTLVHEAAHFLAYHRAELARNDVETVAESAAYVVLSHFGIDTAAYSFGYVARWAQDKAVFRRNLTAIQQTANRLIEAIEGPPELAAGDEADGRDHPPLPTLARASTSTPKAEADVDGTAYTNLRLGIEEPETGSSTS